MNADALAFRKQLAALRPELLRRAHRLECRSPEDLVHDAMVRALEFEGTYAAGTNLRAWVHRILFSIFIVQVRRRRDEHRGHVELAACDASWPHGDPPPDMLALWPPVRRALEELPGVFREAVVLIDLQDRSYVEAAAELQIPQGTLASRVTRGRRMLAAQLEAVRDAA